MMMRKSSLTVVLATVCMIVANLPKLTSGVSYSYSGPGSPPSWHVSPDGSSSFSYSGTGPIPPEIARFLPPGVTIHFGPPNNNQPSPSPPSRRVDPGNRRRCHNAAQSETWWQCVAARRAHAQCCNFWTSVKRNCLAGMPDSEADQIEPRLSRHCCDNNHN